MKKKPDAVLLRALLGERGPTFCPVCKRLVVMHNPRPKDGSTPPQTEAEYAASHPNYATPVGGHIAGAAAPDGGAESAGGSTSGSAAEPAGASERGER